MQCSITRCIQVLFISYATTVSILMSFYTPQTLFTWGLKIFIMQKEIFYVLCFMPCNVEEYFSSFYIRCNAKLSNMLKEKQHAVRKVNMDNHWFYLPTRIWYFESSEQDSSYLGHSSGASIDPWDGDHDGCTSFSRHTDLTCLTSWGYCVGGVIFALDFLDRFFFFLDCVFLVMVTYCGWIGECNIRFLKGNHSYLLFIYKKILAFPA